MTRHHMRASIEGLLASKDKLTYLTDDNGLFMTDSQARCELRKLQSKGHKYIPSGNCQGFDPFEKGCPGHQLVELDKT